MSGIRTPKTYLIDTMEINKTKYYKTNRFKSVAFYFAICWPLLTIFLTILMLPHIRDYWFAILFLYLYSIPLEFTAIRYGKVEIGVDEEAITIKRGNKLASTKWADIKELKVLLFNWGWELSYQLITKDKKILGFGDSIEDCGNLIKEIELRTGLKFNKRL